MGKRRDKRGDAYTRARSDKQGRKYLEDGEHKVRKVRRRSITPPDEKWATRQLLVEGVLRDMGVLEDGGNEGRESELKMGKRSAKEAINAIAEMDQRVDEQLDELLERVQEPTPTAALSVTSASSVSPVSKSVADAAVSLSGMRGKRRNEILAALKASRNRERTSSNKDERVEEFKAEVTFQRTVEKVEIKESELIKKTTDNDNENNSQASNEDDSDDIFTGVGRYYRPLTLQDGKDGGSGEGGRKGKDDNGGMNKSNNRERE